MRRGVGKRQSVFRAICACIRGQLAPLSNFPYPNREQLPFMDVLTRFGEACTMRGVLPGTIDHAATEKSGGIRPSVAVCLVRVFLSDVREYG